MGAATLTQLNYERIMRVLVKDDAPSLRDYLQQGISPDLTVTGESILRMAVKSRAAHCLVVLLQHGANTEISTHNERIPPPLYEAVTKGALEMVRGLLWGGADVGITTLNQNNLLHDLAKASPSGGGEAIADRLVLAGADPVAVSGQWKPWQAVRGGSAQLRARLAHYADFAEALANKELSLEHMLKTRLWRGHEAVWLDLPGVYHSLDVVLDQLSSRGERIERAAFLPPESSNRRLASLVLSGHLGMVNAYFLQHGEAPILAHDLVHTSGPNEPSALDMIAEEWGERQLISSHWFGALSTSGKAMLVSGLPQEALARLPNLRAMLVRGNAVYDTAQGRA